MVSARPARLPAGLISSLDRREDPTVLKLIGVALAACVAVAAGAAAASSAVGACAPGYRPCLPVRADLDCSQIDDALKPVRVTGADQYGLDRDRDGFGCDVAGEGGGARSPWGLILQKPRGKEARTARVGETLFAVGWSPRAMKGTDYQLCVLSPAALTCKQTLDGGLTGTVQGFGTWKVVRQQVVRGVLKVVLRARRGATSTSFQTKTFDTVPIR
jgi:hypothetical protein